MFENKKAVDLLAQQIEQQTNKPKQQEQITLEEKNNVISQKSNLTKDNVTTTFNSDILEYFKKLNISNNKIEVKNLNNTSTCNTTLNEESKGFLKSENTVKEKSLENTVTQSTTVVATTTVPTNTTTGFSFGGFTFGGGTSGGGGSFSFGKSIAAPTTVTSTNNSTTIITDKSTISTSGGFTFGSTPIGNTTKEKVITQLPETTSTTIPSTFTFGGNKTTAFTFAKTNTPTAFKGFTFGNATTTTLNDKVTTNATTNVEEILSTTLSTADTSTSQIEIGKTTSIEYKTSVENNIDKKTDSTSSTKESTTINEKTELFFENEYFDNLALKIIELSEELNVKIDKINLKQTYYELKIENNNNLYNELISHIEKYLKLIKTFEKLNNKLTESTNTLETMNKILESNSNKNLEILRNEIKKQKKKHFKILMKMKRLGIKLFSVKLNTYKNYKKQLELYI
ncbi:hypothetical protein ABK040_003603 [Willaertia magna]